jgi:hypothetical protein
MCRLEILPNVTLAVLEKLTVDEPLFTVRPLNEDILPVVVTLLNVKSPVESIM